MTTHSSTVVLCLVNNSLQAWEAMPEKCPELVPLQGQEQLTICNVDNLYGAWRDLIERLDDNGHTPEYVYWLLDSEGQTQWLNAVRQNNAITQIAWQVLAWEWLTERLNLPTDAQLNLKEKVLPWLVSTEQRALTLAQEHEAARLTNERHRLEQDNKQLRALNAALQKPDSEKLITYLPALYPRIFTQLGASELAALCGKIEPFNIPNPYPEPSTEILITLQKNFRNLPRDYQLDIVRFLTRLPQWQKISPRPEMAELIRKLEQDC